MIELQSFCSAVAPRSELHPARWCAKHVHVENSEVSSKFDPDQLRWWIKPMGHFADYVTRHMVCIMPTGFGKSTFFESITCWITSESPGSILYASQNDSDAEMWGETRLRKALAKCEPLKELWPSNERNNFRKDALIWPHMFMAIGGANASNFNEKSITYGLGDEAWIWKHGLVREWLARSHSRENRKFVLASQAGVIKSDDGMGQTSELHLEHDKCRQWDFAWKCDCGSVQPFQFEQLVWDTVETGEITDDQATAETCRRVCPSCGKEHPDDVATRRKLHDSYEENDGYLCVRETGLKGYEGFHVDAGANWRIAWAEDVIQKIQADRQAALGDETLLRQWTQKRRALGWKEGGEIKPITLASSGYNIADYATATKIPGEVFRFATLDAGDGHFWLRIRAWLEGGDSKGLYFNYFLSDDEAAKKCLEYGVEPKHTFLDFGYLPAKMAEIALRHGWEGMKGDGNRKNGWEWQIASGPNKGQKEMRLYNVPHWEKATDGRRSRVWTIATEPLQYILQRLINGEGAKWEVADDEPELFLKHLNGEQLGITKDKNGNDVRKWQRKGQNHGRDTEVYQLAAAIMLRAFAPSRGDQQAAEQAQGE